MPDIFSILRLARLLFGIAERGRFSSEVADDVLKSKLGRVVDDFVGEVELCSDCASLPLSHLRNAVSVPAPAS